jgi:Putative secretion activating protein
MSNFKEAMALLETLEFNSPSNILHKNSNEKDVTFYGIYKYAHPSWIGWDKVSQAIEATGNLERASVILSKDEELKAQVYKFYKAEFWDVMKLDYINDNIKANEMFIFGVNAGHHNAIKAAQKLVGVSVDGVIGEKTIKAINDYDMLAFDLGYDRLELAYYQSLIEKNPSLVINERGWIRRAKAV